MAGSDGPLLTSAHERLCSEAPGRYRRLGLRDHVARVLHHPADPRRPGDRHAGHQCRRPGADRAPASAARTRPRHNIRAGPSSGSAMCCVAISATPTGTAIRRVADRGEHAGDHRADGSEPRPSLPTARRSAWWPPSGATRRSTPRRWAWRVRLHVDPQLLARAAADLDVRGGAALVRRGRRHVVEASSCPPPPWRWGRPGSTRDSLV